MYYFLTESLHDDTMAQRGSRITIISWNFSLTRTERNPSLNHLDMHEV